MTHTPPAPREAPGAPEPASAGQTWLEELCRRADAQDDRGILAGMPFDDTAFLALVAHAPAQQILKSHAASLEADGPPA